MNKRFAKSVGIAIVISLSLLYVMVTCVDKANSGVIENLDRGTRGTFYDETYSVFCASRVNAVSCVYVPRDTVRRGE